MQIPPKRVVLILGLNAILETSGAHNPIEQQSANEFIRDSKANIFNWKNRLSQNEIDKIKKKRLRFQIISILNMNGNG
jgi:hypothetical protein